MSNDSAVKLKQLTSSMKQMSDYLNEKILRLTKPLNYSRIIGGTYDKGLTPNYTEYSGNSGDVKVIGALGFSNLPDWIVKI